MAIDKDMLDQLLAGRDPQDLFAKDGLLDELKKALSERMLSAELDDHLENEGAAGAVNRRNGSSKKTMLTGTSKVTLDVPRDRAGTFDPKLIAKYQRRFPDFDDKIISMYARGMTVREIRGHLEELYGIDVSPDLISTVTDAVLETVGEWQSRPLDTCYPLVFFDAIRVKIRDEGFVRNKAVYIALGIQPDGTKEVLGIWIEQTEGAKFWLRVMNELKNRGIADILIAVVDGLKGFPEAINAVFPETIVQTCIVHLIRNSMSFASWKDRKLIAQALRSVYRAETPEAGLAALQAFEEGHWGKKHPAIAQSWRRHWDQVIPFFAFPEGVRRIIYTTNAIEALNSKIRRAVRTRGHFPGDDAAMKLLYLVLNHAADEWKRPPREWGEAKSQFAVIFGERFVIRRQSASRTKYRTRPHNTRESMFKPRLRFASIEEGNAWLLEESLRQASAQAHPDLAGTTIAQAFELERASLRPVGSTFDGFFESDHVASSTCLVSFDRNRYSVMAKAGRQTVQVRAYATRIVIRCGDEVVAEHPRLFGRDQVRYDPWHYVPVLARKPGALRNGAPFIDWSLPPGLAVLRKALGKGNDADRRFVRVLAQVPEEGLEAVEAAINEALGAGLGSDEVILNILSRRRLPPACAPVSGLTNLRLAHPPKADCSRYDLVRGIDAAA